MRQRHVELFCWAFKKCLCECWFYVSLSGSASLCTAFWPTACCFLWDMAFSYCGVCFRKSIVIRPVRHPLHKGAQVRQNFARVWQCFQNSEPQSPQSNGNKSFNVWQIAPPITLLYRWKKTAAIWSSGSEAEQCLCFILQRQASLHNVHNGVWNPKWQLFNMKPLLQLASPTSSILPSLYEFQSVPNDVFLASRRLSASPSWPEDREKVCSLMLYQQKCSWKAQGKLRMQKML